MGTETTSLVVHPEGEQPEVEAWSAIPDTYAGRVHVEWDATAPVTPFGQLPFFIEYLKQGGLFDGWVADCPLSLSSPNASRWSDGGQGWQGKETSLRLEGWSRQRRVILLRRQLKRPLAIVDHGDPAQPRLRFSQGRGGWGGGGEGR